MSKEKQVPKASLAERVFIGGLALGAGAAAVGFGVQYGGETKARNSQLSGTRSADLDQKIDFALKVAMAGMGLMLVSTFGLVHAVHRTRKKHNEKMEQDGLGWQMNMDSTFEGAPTFNALPPEIRSQFRHHLCDSMLDNFVLTDPKTGEEFDFGDQKKVAALLEAAAAAFKPHISLSLEQPDARSR